MSAVQPFDFNGAQTRALLIDGEPWFVAADVAAILGYRMASDMTRHLDTDDTSNVTANTIAGYAPDAYMQVSVISEAGLYRAIVQRETGRIPDQATADRIKAFQRWVTREVLPAIRKTGVYGAPALSGPELLARAVLEADATIKQLAPKAEAFDAFLSTSGDYSVNEAAKVLSRNHDILTGEKRLRDWMQANGWLYRDASNKPRAYQRHIDLGRLTEKAQWHYHPETGEKVLDTPQVRVTARGIDALAKALTKVTDQCELDIEQVTA